MWPVSAVGAAPTRDPAPCRTSSLLWEATPSCPVNWSVCYLPHRGLEGHLLQRMMVRARHAGMEPRPELERGGLTHSDQSLFPSDLLPRALCSHSEAQLLHLQVRIITHGKVIEMPSTEQWPGSGVCPHHTPFFFLPPPSLPVCPLENLAKVII